MSAQDLADETERLGLPIGRSVLANLENGRRTTLSVAELLVLARALRVPPLVLLFPIGQVEEVELPPGDKVTTWIASQWFAGEVLIPDREEFESQFDDSPLLSEPITGPYAPIAYYRHHEELVSEWSRAKHDARRARQGAETTTDQEERESASARADTQEREAIRIEREIARLRNEMRRDDVTPPQLPKLLRHIEDDDGGGK